MTNLPTFNILICHLPERRSLLNDLLASITRQVKYMDLDDSIKVLINANPDMNIGQKRNTLLKAAPGEYVAFIDDDDQVGPYYIPRIMLALTEHPDVVGMQGLLWHTKGVKDLDRNTLNGCWHETFTHSLCVQEWYDGPDPDFKENPTLAHKQEGKLLKRYFRSPNHLNPVKAAIARSVGFPETSHGEDHDYSRRLLPLLKTEVMLRGPIYHYITG